MSSHNSVSDVAIYRQWLSFFHSSHHPSCSGEDVVLPKALFSSECLLVLSACSTLGVWYHEAIMYRWLDCQFVQFLHNSCSQLCKLHKGDIYNDKVSLTRTKTLIEQKPHTTIPTPMLAQTLSLHTLTHTNTNMNQLLITA